MAILQAVKAPSIPSPTKKVAQVSHKSVLLELIVWQLCNLHSVYYPAVPTPVYPLLQVEHWLRFVSCKV